MTESSIYKYRILKIKIFDRDICMAILKNEDTWYKILSDYDHK